MTGMPSRPTRPRALCRPGSVLFPALLFGACSGAELREGRPLWTGGQANGERTMVSAEWEERWTLGGPDDDLLAGPSAITAMDGGIVLGDMYDGRVLAVGLDGAIRWSFGRKGDGPGEFRRIQSIQVDREGVIHVLDGENRRITLLGGDGAWLGDVSVPDGMWFSLVPLEDGYILEGSDPDVPFRRVIVDAPGATAPRPTADSGASAPGPPASAPRSWTVEPDGPAFGLPWDGFPDLHFLQRQGHVIASRDGRWAYAFSFGNGWFPHRGPRPLDYLGQNVEHADFPQVVTVTSSGDRSTRLRERPGCTHCSGWITGDTVHFHVGGRTGDAFRLVDRYDWESGAYLNTLRLPARANRAVQVGDTYVLLVQSPWPALSAWTLRGSAGLSAAASGEPADEPSDTPD